LSAQTVFADATTYPAIVLLRKEPRTGPLRYIAVPQGLIDSPVISASIIEELPAFVADQGALTRKMWPPLATDDTLWEKLTANTETLGNLADKVFVGLQTSADKVYAVESLGAAGKGLTRVRSRLTGKSHELESELLKPFLTGKNISRYFSPTPHDLLLFPYHVFDLEASLIPEKEFAKRYPRAWDYLNLGAIRSALEAREDHKFEGVDWYRFGRTQNLGIHGQPKIAIPSTVKHLEACYDVEGEMYLDNVRVNGILLKDKTDTAYKYVLGLLNSSLLHWFFTRLATPFANGWFGANRQFIEPLPIRLIDPSSVAELKMRDDLVVLVEQMIVLQKKLQQTQAESREERQELERQIRRTDEKIDDQVCDLYNLGEVERKAVGL
jgi:hypothetical protein